MNYQDHTLKGDWSSRVTKVRVKVKMLVKYLDNVGVLTSRNVCVYNEVKSYVRPTFGKNVDLFNMITLVVCCKTLNLP